MCYIPSPNIWDRNIGIQQAFSFQAKLFLGIKVKGIWYEFAFHIIVVCKNFKYLILSFLFRLCGNLSIFLLFHEFFTPFH